MQDDEEAQDVVDVQPYHEPSKKAARPFPWVVLVIGLVVSAIIMAAITISTVPLSIVASH